MYINIYIYIYIYIYIVIVIIFIYLRTLSNVTYFQVMIHIQLIDILRFRLNLTLRLNHLLPINESYEAYPHYYN